MYCLEINNNQVIKSLVEANFGIAILSSRTVQMEVGAERLSSLKISDLALERPLNFVTRNECDLTAPARAFRSVLLASTSPPES